MNYHTAVSVRTEVATGEGRRVGEDVVAMVLGESPHCRRVVAATHEEQHELGHCVKSSQLQTTVASHITTATLVIAIR